MKIMMLKDAPVEVSKTISVTRPKDWIGDVEDAVGKKLVAVKAARRIEPEKAEKAEKA